MNGILSGLPTGILTDPRQAMMLNMGLGLMQASGPSRYPTGVGQAFGNAGMQGLQAGQQAQQAQLQEAYRQAQIKKMEEQAAIQQQMLAIQQQKANQPQVHSMSPGGILVDREGKVIAQAPFKEQNVPGQKMTRQYQSGNDLVTEEYVDGQWRELGRGPKFQPTKPPMQAPLKPPIGYRPTPSGDLEPIPGGPKDTKQMYKEKTVGLDVKGDRAQFDAATSAAESLHGINQVIEHLRTSDASTGMAAEIKNNIDRAKVLIAQNEKAGKRVADTEVLDAMLGSQVFPMISALGIGARGLDTPAEREFLRKVMTGTITLNKETLVKMAEIRRDVAERAIDKFNARIDSGEIQRTKINKPPRPNVAPARGTVKFGDLPK